VLGVTPKRAAFSRRALISSAPGAAMLLAACGGSGGAGKDAGPGSRAVDWSGIQEIEVWVTNSVPVVDAYKQLIAQFQRENPRVRIAGGEGVPKVGTSANLVPAVAAGTPPNAAEVNQPNTWAFAGQEIYVPLNEFVKRDKETSRAQSDFYPGQLEACTWRNSLYFFPVGVSMEVWHANRTFWQRAGLSLAPDGWTWSDLSTKIGPALKSAAGSEGSAFMMELGEMYRILAFMKQNGGDMFDKSGTKITIADAASIEAFEFVRDLVVKGILTEKDENGKNFRLDGLRVAMELEGMTRIPAYRRAVGDNQARLPAPKKKVRANIYDSWVVGLIRSSDAAKMEASYQWLAWLVKPENNLVYQKARANLPARKAVAQLPNAADLWGTEPLIKAALDDLNYGTTFPFTPATGMIRTALNQQVVPAILRDGQPAAQTLKQAVTTLESQFGALLK
jgi:multiple sugar transport system substrate-binding protein